MKKLLAVVAVVSAVMAAGAAKVADTQRVVAKDVWYGFDRTVFEFRGREAWIVEPKTEAEDRPWVWIMKRWGHTPRNADFSGHLRLSPHRKRVKGVKTDSR